jgi:putative colanic acid biosynthesis glycosyltransferase
LCSVECCKVSGVRESAHKVLENINDLLTMRLLSIITVCRNDSTRLERTISSLGAFYGDQRFEHVVVDGESVDETNMVVAPLLKATNFRFYSSRDCGIYDAMNRGVMLSKAPLLLFLNCGDAIIASPDEFSVFLRPLVTGSVVCNDIVCFPVQQVGISGCRTLSPGRVSLFKMPTSHQGMVFSKSFLLRNRYQAAYKIAGDYDVYLRAERVGIFSNYSSRPLVAVEVDGLASSNPFGAYREYLVIARHRLHGGAKLIVMLCIFARALVIITVKLILPRRWISALRGV